MNIEQKLEVIRKALEMGAEVELFIGSFKENYQQYNETESLQNIQKLAVMVGSQVVAKEHGGSKWWAIRNEWLKATAHYEHQSYMIEDIDFEGVEEHA